MTNSISSQEYQPQAVQEAIDLLWSEQLAENESLPPFYDPDSLDAQTIARTINSRFGIPIIDVITYLTT